jgi:glucosyl-dolichyl phosphate glucuronosyltransferase
MSASLQISVVICTYNRAQYLQEALDSLYRQTLPHHQFEVIVVDNNSIDQTKEICEAFITAHPDARFYYFLETQQGASFARNSGAAKAKSPLLCFMDDDAVADLDYLERIVTFFNQHPDAGGLGGRIIPRYIPDEPVWMSHYV